MVAGGAAVAVALVAGGIGVGDAIGASRATPDTSSSTTSGTNGSSGSSGTSGQLPGMGQAPGYGSGFPGGTTGDGSSGSGSSSSTGTGTAATAAQTAGVVTIVSKLGYEEAESAGTGLILTSSGEILTNNHVIDGATSITVTVETTNKAYKATVVGTDATDDVAVLRLTDASGLTVAKLSTSGTVTAGEKVVGVGNAGGTGTLTAATGSVTGTGRTITASDETGSNSEQLTGLIETDADVVAGDSGGPLYDSSGAVIGIDTAASTATATTQRTSTATGTSTSGGSDAYAIPIATATTIAKKITSGQASSTITIGLPAFLGVSIASSDSVYGNPYGYGSSTASGATVGSVVTGGAAAKAGITAGSVITAVGGHAVTSADSLESRLATYSPGDRVTIHWTDAAGTAHVATVTLASGPAN